MGGSPGDRLLYQLITGIFYFDVGLEKDHFLLFLPFMEVFFMGKLYLVFEYTNIMFVLYFRTS